MTGASSQLFEPHLRRAAALGMQFPWRRAGARARAPSLRRCVAPLVLFACFAPALAGYGAVFAPPPLPPTRDATVCPYVTNRWFLNAGFADGSVVIDSVGAWNGTAYGGYAYDAENTGAIVFDGSTGYVDLGSRAFGAPVSFAFWARVRAVERRAAAWPRGGRWRGATRAY